MTLKDVINSLTRMIAVGKTFAHQIKFSEFHFNEIFSKISFGIS